MNSANAASLIQPNPHQVIIVDADVMITDLMKYNLENEGYVVRVCKTAEEALEQDFSSTDLVITEVVLGEINGLMLAGMLKGGDATADIPVIMCSTLDSEDDIVKGFEAGADDYILKPFSLRELMARVKSVLRRRSMLPPKPVKTAGANALHYRSLLVDPDSRSVTIDGHQLPITRTELLLLQTLMGRPGHFFTHADLYEQVWNKQADGSSRALDVSVSRLRRKLGDYGANIVNRSGVGYGFIEK